jgi:hypothetical protein
MTSWIGQIENAHSTDEVVAIVRDYIALWSPEEIAALPVPVRPGRVRDEADVADLHDRLVEAYRTTRASGDALATLQRLTGFMAQPRSASRSWEARRARKSRTTRPRIPATPPKG